VRIFEAENGCHYKNTKAEPKKNAILTKKTCNCCLFKNN